MISSGRNSIQLFNVQTNVERELQKLAYDRLFEKLGLEKPKGTQIHKFDIPAVPKAGDYMFFPFRHLSATVVGAGSYKATDFSKGNVLKKSVPLLDRRPAYLNHDQSIGKGIGWVQEPEWVGSYKHADGYDIPGGIEAPFVIDSVLHPDLCRQMSAPVSCIDSASVTVVFEWEASHDFEREGDFYWHLGEEIDGEMVRRIVTNILAYEESSLVWLGADPYAKMLNDDGELVTIDRASAFSKQKFNANIDVSRKYFVYDCLDNKKFLHLSKSNEKITDPKPEKVITMNEELVAFLAAGFGVTADELKAGKFDKAKAEKFKIVAGDSYAKLKSEEEFNTLTTAKKKAEDDLATAKTELTKVEGEKATLVTEKAKLEVFSKAGEAILVAARAEAVRVYGVFAKGKPEKVLEEELNAETDIAKLNIKIQSYGGKAIQQFTGKCTKCGSEEVSYRSSLPGEGNEPVIVTENDNWQERAITR